MKPAIGIKEELRKVRSFIGYVFTLFAFLSLSLPIGACFGDIAFFVRGRQKSADWRLLRGFWKGRLSSSDFVS